jgi:LPXTG-site transpeptidase (sortase) family protein
MRNWKLNHWLVALGALLVLLGIADAIMVVRATPAAQSAQPEHARPKTLKFRAAVEARESGFLPVQTLRGEADLEQASPARRLPFEAEGEMAVNAFADPLILPAERPSETPQLIWIPDIDLYAPVRPVELEVVEIDQVEYDQWEAPTEYAAGWHASSAPLGEPGNTVLNGHHNIYGDVFGRLVELEVGDEIVLYSDRAAHTYRVVERVIFPERFAKAEQRVENARWVLPTGDERLTLITCWPYESNTHRLVLVAKPVSGEK